jgi:hypothetical protein
VLDINVHISKCGFVGLMYKLVTIWWNQFKPLSDIGNMVGSIIHKSTESIIVTTPITKLSNLVTCEKISQQVAHLICKWTFQLMFSYIMHQKIGTMHVSEFKCHGAMCRKHRNGGFMASDDALPTSFIDSNVSPRWKHWKRKELGYAPWLATF